MKNLFNVILIWFIFCLTTFLFAEEIDIWEKVFVDINGRPIIDAKAAILMDGETGQILYSHNPDLRLPNASTTKIMTALLVVENLDLDSMLTASKNVSETPFTSIYLTDGEQISVKDALAGAIIKSANDACVLFAENISGDCDKFAQLMNERAKELGCKNTNFVTPNGLNDENHYSTAKDLCVIAKEAIRYPVISELSQRESWILSSRSINKENLLVKNKQKYILNYPYATGLKPGYTKQAGNCLVGTAEKNGRILISCILNSSEISAQTAALMEYGFNRFEKKVILKKDDFREYVKVSNSEEGQIPARIPMDLFILIPKGLKKTEDYEYKWEFFQDISAPVEEGQVIGKVIAYKNGEGIASLDILAEKSAKELPLVSSIKKNIYKPLIIIVILVVLVYYARKIAKNHGSKRSRFQKKVRRADISGQSYSRRYKSYTRSKSRPEYKSDTDLWKRY